MSPERPARRSVRRQRRPFVSQFVPLLWWLSSLRGPCVEDSMSSRARQLSFVCGAVVVAGAALLAQQSRPADEAALVKRAQAIHERVIALDTHDDINPRN